MLWIKDLAAASYDLVVACNVMPAAHSIDLTLENLRSLLKPGGRLILMEITRKPDLLRPVIRRPRELVV